MKIKNSEPVKQTDVIISDDINELRRSNSETGISKKEKEALLKSHERVHSLRMYFNTLRASYQEMLTKISIIKRNNRIVTKENNKKLQFLTVCSDYAVSLLLHIEKVQKAIDEFEKYLDILELIIVCANRVGIQGFSLDRFNVEHGNDV